MPEAIFRHGDVTGYMDYTPTGGNVAAGEVVLIGNTTGLTCGIAHLDILNNALGALALGGGIYDVTMLGNHAAGSNVWWDNTNNKVTTTSTNNAYFGMLIEGGTGANTVVEALHQPYAGIGL
jgi:hypothetical protein